MYSYLEIIPDKFTEVQWREYYRLREDLHLRYDDQLYIGFENFKESAIYQIRNNGFSIFIFMQEDKMIGYLRYWINNPGHATAQNNIVVCSFPEELSSKKLDHVIAKCLFDKMKKEGHVKCIWRSSHPHTLSLIKKLDGKASNSGSWFKLDLRKVKKELIDKWRNAVDPEKLGLTIHYFDFIPEEWIEETAMASNEIINDMVREDNSLQFHFDANALRKAQENFRKTGSQPLHILLTDQYKKIVGLSLIVIHTEPDKIGDQRITGIVRQWRGKGLAKWMKAKMLEIVLKDHERIMELKTECFSTNEPMIRLNKALGYELYRTDHDLYIYPQSLESFLKGV